MPEPVGNRDGQVLHVPVSVGELVDKLTILELKRRHLRGEALGHAERVPAELLEQLRQVNGDL